MTELVNQTAKLSGAKAEVFVSSVVPCFPEMPDGVLFNYSVLVHLDGKSGISKAVSDYWASVGIKPVQIKNGLNNGYKPGDTGQGLVTGISWSKHSDPGYDPQEYYMVGGLSRCVPGSVSDSRSMTLPSVGSTLDMGSPVVG